MQEAQGCPAPWCQESCWAVASHLHAVLGEEGTGVGLGGQLQAGGIAPERAAAEQQARCSVLVAAVALPKEVWGQESGCR